VVQYADVRKPCEGGSVRGATSQVRSGILDLNVGRAGSTWAGLINQCGNTIGSMAFAR
jgi:hypothetical protein